MTLNKPVFIHSLSQRSGHNFLSKIIRSQTEADVFIHDTHEVILPSILAEKLDEMNNSTNFVRNKKAKVKEIEIIAQKYQFQDRNLIFKTSLLSSNHEIDLFKKCDHIILLRHPQDLFVSYEKSVYSFRKSIFKNKIKLILRPIYSFYILNKWAKKFKKRIKELKKIESSHLLINYESVMTLEGQVKIFDFLDLPINLEKPIKVENINSSFARDSDRWKIPTSNQGNTTSRFEKSPLWLKLMIRFKLKKVVRSLNYELK